MSNEATGGAPLPHYDSHATSTAVASPVQGAASATDRATDEREALADLRKAVLDGVSDEWLLGFIRQQPLAASSASASGAKFGQGGATPDNSGPINHAEAYELACAKRDKSNLARCYIDLRAALAERAQAQPSGAVPVGTVVGMPGSGGGFTMCAFNASDVPVGTELYIATPAPEQEAAQGAGREQDVKTSETRMNTGSGGGREAAQVAPPGAQEEWLSRGAVVRYTAPVPATTPAEQPEGDSSHVMRPFGATAGQHEAGAAAVCEACGCASASPGTRPLCEPCRAEFKAWCASKPLDTDTRPAFNPYDAGQTRDPSKLKGGPQAGR